jgi:succinate dehydrogenase hydrophobic anchor subunit
MQNVPLKEENTRKERSFAGAMWLVQAFSGLLLLPLLLLHMVAHHFVVEGGLRDFQQVLDYVSNPAIFFITIVFLIVVTIHAMLGLRAIVLDLDPSPPVRTVLDWALTVIGLATIIYGVWLEITIAGM